MASKAANPLTAIIAGGALLGSISFLGGCARTYTEPPCPIAESPAPSKAPSILTRLADTSLTNGQPLEIQILFMSPVEREITPQDRISFYIIEEGEQGGAISDTVYLNQLLKKAEAGKKYSLQTNLPNNLGLGKYRLYQRGAQIGGEQQSSITTSDPEAQKRLGSSSSTGEEFSVK